MESAVSNGRSDWSCVECVGFRWLCAYFVLYSFPFPVGMIPGTQWLSAGYDHLWEACIPWVGKHVLRLSDAITVLPNGSGDTTFNYVQQLCFVVLSMLQPIMMMNQWVQ